VVQQVLDRRPRAGSRPIRDVEIALLEQAALAGPVEQSVTCGPRGDGSFGTAIP